MAHQSHVMFSRRNGVFCFMEAFKQFLIFSVLFDVVSSQDPLKQVIVVTRHGSRYPLVKSGKDLTESTPGMLTFYGQKQMYDLGWYLRAMYNQVGVLDAFHPSLARLESSSYERTITSANSLALGLFDTTARDPASVSFLSVTPANVPVYTHELDNDISIRAYDKCPALLVKLQDLYQSDSWLQIQNDNMQLLKGLAQITQFRPYSNGDGFVALSDLYNVYDDINVAKTECSAGYLNQNATCNTLPDAGVANVLSDADWLKVKSIAHKAELMKYGQKVLGKWGGVNLLLEIANRMKSNSYTFSLFSAHYPTLLGIFAAIEIPFFDEIVIPNYAASLIFEVRAPAGNNGTLNFNLIYKGTDQSLTGPVPVSLTHICGKNDSCPVSSLTKYLAGWNATRWCQECENNSSNACLQIKLSSNPSSATNNSGANNSAGNTSGTNNSGTKQPMIAGFFIGLAVGVVGMLVAAFAMFNITKTQSKPDLNTTATDSGSVITTTPAEVSPWEEVISPSDTSEQHSAAGTENHSIVSVI